MNVSQIYDGSAGVDELWFGCRIVADRMTVVSRSDVMIIQFTTSDPFTSARDLSARYHTQLAGKRLAVRWPFAITAIPPFHYIQLNVLTSAALRVHTHIHVYH